MPGPLTTEAVVLRSMRFGEADRILHLYTPGRGRIGAIAKGVRRSRSRFGGRLEPFFRLPGRVSETPEAYIDWGARSKFTPETGAGECAA